MSNNADIDVMLLLMLVILMLLNLNTKYSDTHADQCVTKSCNVCLFFCTVSCDKNHYYTLGPLLYQVF